MNVWVLNFAKAINSYVPQLLMDFVLKIMETGVVEILIFSTLGIPIESNLFIFGGYGLRGIILFVLFTYWRSIALGYTVGLLISYFLGEFISALLNQAI